MEHQEMDRLIETHIAAEAAGDTAGAVAVYTDDVEHDVVGFPPGRPTARPPREASTTFSCRTSGPRRWSPTHSYYGDDFCVIEHDWTGTVPGEFLGVPGNGRRITLPDGARLRVPRRTDQSRERLARRRHRHPAAHCTRARHRARVTNFSPGRGLTPHTTRARQETPRNPHYRTIAIALPQHRAHPIECHRTPAPRLLTWPRPR